jgi:mannose-6-phosphate isomerase
MPDPNDPGADPWLARPWRLLPNRVSRFYRGGLLIDRFRGSPDARDTDRPEDWVGSATRAWTPPGAPPTDAGLSAAEIDGEVRRVVDVVPDTGVLVKLLDAGNRLPVHAHPSRAFARQHLGSRFGKSEAWVILATRQIPGQPAASLRLGFRCDVGRAELRRWIDEQDVAALMDAMHERPARAGDAWFVPAGMPHAIGAGSLILEVQEPTDFSIVLERRGFPVTAQDAHLGLGWDVTLDAIDRRSRTDDELDSLRSDATVDGSLLAPDADAFFSVRRVRVSERQRLALPSRYAVGAVISGAGAVATDGGRLPIDAGTTFAIPPGVAASAEIEARAEPVELLLCMGGTG